MVRLIPRLAPASLLASAVWLDPACLRTRAPVMAANPAVALSDLKVYELKAVCRAKGLKVSGRKAELVERILAATVESPAAAPAPAATKGGKRKGAAKVPPMPTPTPASPPPTVAAPSFVEPLRSAVDVEVVGGATSGMAPEVLSGDASEWEELRAEQRSRRTNRRAKLSEYFNEEYAKTVGSLESAAGDPYAQAVGMPAIESISIGGLSSVNFELPQLTPALSEASHRFGWCREYDAATGVGVIVDLHERTEWRVDRSALGSSAANYDATLFVGEFVEYLPAAAAQAQAQGGTTPSGNEGWVRGIMGWPLMCDAVSGESAPVEPVPAGAR